MSNVKVNQRHTNKAQYIDTARELVVHTISYAKKFPKSAMFLITKELVDLSRKIYVEVVTANACYPKTAADVAFRRAHLLEARGAINALDGLLSIAKELFNPEVSEYGWIHWGDLINKEKTLIGGIMSSDSALNFPH